MDIKEKVIGGSILGSDTFVNWVRDKFLPSKSREIPAVQRLKKICGAEIGEMMGVDYSTVSLERKRLREKLKSDKRLSQITKRVEADLSIINRLSENTFTRLALYYILTNSFHINNIWYASIGSTSFSDSL